MGLRRIGVMVLIMTVTGCSSVEWVHPNKPKSEFAQEYNKCENQSLQDPKLQSGSKLLLQQAVEKCLAKKGWILREKRQ